MEYLKQIGTVIPKKSSEIKKSKIGLGFEKLDRDIFDPKKAYPFVAESGIKYARLQSGWQKTEKSVGVYDFEWLDEIVDNMLAIGVEPWLCLCYGNKLYTQSAETVFGAVGCPPIKTETERRAWSNYVTAVTRHFKGRIHYYEIWNEPDGTWCWKHGPNPDELADFTVATAKACKIGDADCEVIGFATCITDFDFCETLCKRGVLEHIDGISYHAYRIYDREFKEIFDFYDNIRKKYAPSLKIIQGESGTQSSSAGCGAMAGGNWTELKQAKYLLRHLTSDLYFGVEFTSYFSCMDMAEALNGSTNDIQSVSDFGYFGVVGADFDENARATGNYHKKPAFYALQNFTSVMCEDFSAAEIDINPVSEYCPQMLDENFNFDNATKYFFKRNSRSGALIYWTPENILTTTYNGYTSFKIKACDASENVVLINPLDGKIYSLDEKHLITDGKYLYFKNIPITDCPLILSFNNFYNM